MERKVKRYSQSVVQTGDQLMISTLCTDCGLVVKVTIAVETPNPICPEIPCITSCDLLNDIRTRAQTFLQQYMPTPRLLGLAASPFECGCEEKRAPIEGESKY
jgi:hypothetical protein